MVSMKARQLKALIDQICFRDQKMAFVSGPRQCGKTTLAKMLLEERRTGAYHNWDDVEFRRLWTKDPKAAVPKHSGEKVPLVVFDEIHKAKFWKRTLKGVYDTLAAPADIMVTGSARLNVYRRGSDSLLGRYYHFRLHPFTLREMETTTVPGPDDVITRLQRRSLRMVKQRQKNLDDLLQYGPFPEPLLAQNQRRARLWRRNRIERVIREDLRDLSRTLELSRVEMLAALLPERVGSPLPLSPLADYLEVSYDTVKRWMNFLSELYYIFELRPYTKQIVRGLRKERKVYFWDAAEVEDPGPRFENLIAGHLLKACHIWTDCGEGVFELFYLRNKEKQEIDFLITRDGKAWLPVEAKLSEANPSPNWRKLLPQLPCKFGLQLCAAPGHWRVYSEGRQTLLVASAAEALYYLP
ncbi:MAG: ATP-binding protein [Deltaproteobacteria bacterium]|nr:MAG: ATP-binding protein [Deltaproteobacteria bacterium]